MRVLMVSWHGCIRVVKEALALMSKGITVDVIAQRMPFGANKFNTFTMFNDDNQLRNAIADSRADIIHCHNEPDELVIIAREATNKPIVFDIHDLESMRWNAEPDQMENNAFAAANGFVHVSDSCKNAAEKHHGKEKPSIVLHSYVNQAFVNGVADSVSWSAICYEGGLSVEKLLIDLDGTTAKNYRNWLPATETIVKQGYVFDLFAASNLQSWEYENAGASVLRQLPYPSLMTTLKKYGFGIVGAPVDVPLMQAAMPNKLFEYIACGVVPIMINANEAHRYCEEMGEIGIRLNDFDNLADQLAKAFNVRKRLLKVRKFMTMEQNINPLIELYEAVL